MLITQQRSEMLVALNPVIEKAWGVCIGLDTPYGGFVKATDDFVICWEGREEATRKYHLVSMMDYNQSSPDSIVLGERAEYASYDHLVEDFINRVDTALMDGEIGFCPAVTEKVGDIEYTVTKQPENMFNIDIKRQHVKEMTTMSLSAIKEGKHISTPEKDMQIIQHIVAEHFE